MHPQTTDRPNWTLALALILCLGTALALTSLVQAQTAPAPQTLAGVPGAIDDWWAGVQTQLERQTNGLASSPGWTATGENEGDEFGYSVASAGDVNGDGYADAIVGARGYLGSTNQGAAYIYHGSAAGLAATPALTLTGENDDDRFGTSVAGAGDVNGDGYADVIVGASDYASPFDQGRAYVYHGSAAGLGTTPSLVLTGEDVFDRFGTSVASAGDVNGDGYADIIVGAWGYPRDNEQGAAYVYHGSAVGLAATPALTLTGENDGDRFGRSVASAGDVNGDGYADAIVGAFVYGSGNQGAAYLYHGSGAGLAATPALTLTGENNGDYFGYSVAGAGDVNGDGYADAIVGAVHYPSDNRKGAVYLYHGSSTGLADTPVLTLTGENDGDYFGHSVANAGDVNGDGYADAFVGARGYPSYGGQGRVYAYHGSGAGLGATPVLTLTGENNGDSFGISAAGAGDVNGDGYADTIVGAYGYPGYPDYSYRGRAYLYHGSGAGLASIPALTSTGENDGDRLGYSVASAGDVNGDGYADAIVGARGYPSGAWRGAAYLYHGSDAGLAATPVLTLSGENNSDFFGTSVAGVGDVNGDGYGDVIVGANGYPSGSWKGRAYLYYGSVSGLGATPALTLTGENGGDYLGCSVAGAGDVNGDGYADVLVGANGYTSGQGRAYLYHGSKIGLAATPALTLAGGQDSDRFGTSVAGAGDVNGDGYADTIVGATSYPTSSPKGAAFVYHGSSVGLGARPALTLSGENPGDFFGNSVAGAGDVNGDGYADAIVGAYRYPGGNWQGAAYVYHGSTAGLAATPVLSFTGENDDDYLGASVAGAGDVNGDGYADVIVGADRYPSGGNRGRAYVYHGSGAGLGATPALTLDAEIFGAYFGYSAAGAGDVNGDGYADAIVGAYGYTSFDQKGRTYVYHGNEGGGRMVLARQGRGDGSGIPVQAWGLSQAPDRFQVQLRATDPRGRGRVKLEVEACPPGKAFGNAACATHTASTWTDVTAAPGGVSLSEIVTGLNEDTLYHWRARVLYAPYTVDRPGVTAPPNPEHGPWRRLNGQAVEADVRTSPPNLVVVKSVTPTTAAPGETVTYTYRLTNTGDVSLSGIVAVDDKLGAVTLGASSLAPGERITGVLTYTVGEGDLPGPLVNTVVVTGTPPVGAAVTASDDAVLPLICDPDSYTVTNGNAGGCGSLRQAILNAESHAGHDTIEFSVSGAIVLTETLPAIDDDLTIDGPGADQLQISGDSAYRVFTINSGAAVTITGVTVQDGRASHGGGIWSAGDLTLGAAQVFSNSATNHGGGLYVDEGTVTLSGTQVAGNSADEAGGGVCLSQGGATLSISGGGINSNTADHGGGLYVWYGSATLSGTQVLGNSAAGNAGGVYVWDVSATLSVSGGEIGSNSAGNHGGGIFVNQGSATLTGTQVVGNSAANEGGGIHVFDGSATLNVSGGRIGGNSAHWGGGVVVSKGRATLSETQVLGNSAGDKGGGIHVFNGSATLSQTQVLSNSAANEGGGIHVFNGSTALNGTQVAGNSTVNGGGVYVDEADATLNVSGGRIDSNVASGGGGVYVNKGSATLSQAQVVNNSAGYGGGVLVGGYNATLFINEGKVASNSAAYSGGGVYVVDGTVWLNGTQVSDNSAAESGGGVYVHDGTARLRGTLVVSNSALNGGGIRNGYGTVSVTNSTFYANVASNLGGGILGGAGVFNSTLSANSALTGGGIYTGGTLNMWNSIVANSPSGGDCSGEIDLNYFNLIEDGSCNPALSGDPRLGPLADNGGATRTMALPAGSPVIDAGNDTLCEATDQRGVPRPLDGDGDGTAVCDIGAYEKEPPPSVTVDPTTGGTLTYTDTQGSETVIEVPAGAVTDTTTLVFTPILTTAIPSGFIFAGHAFGLDAYRDGVLLSDLPFGAPVIITLHYTEADIAGLDENTLSLQYWDEGTGTWQDAACGPYDRHPDENWLAVPICHLSQFALFGRSGPHTVYLPVVIRNQ